MGKMVRWSKRQGWIVGKTPYQYHISGLHFFQRMRFPGLYAKRHYETERIQRSLSSRKNNAKTSLR